MHTSARLATFAAIVTLTACSKHAVTTSPRPARDTVVAAPVAPADLTAPDSFSVFAQTTRGPLQLMLYRRWAPAGVDHFYSLVRARYYDNAGVFRVEPGFVVQFGLAADPKLTALYRGQKLVDDSVRTSNLRGTLTFARPAVPNSRTTQLFINLADNARLDTANGFGFPPIGRVVTGMEFVDLFTAEYKPAPPSQGAISTQGNSYLRQSFPKLDYIVSMQILQEWRQ
jgi:peptidyl-prolyl cis-trans isomerase A (cyclophilin A)